MSQDATITIQIEGLEKIAKAFGKDMEQFKKVSEDGEKSADNVKKGAEGAVKATKNFASVLKKSFDPIFGRLENLAGGFDGIGESVGVLESTLTGISSVIGGMGQVIFNLSAGMTGFVTIVAGLTLKIALLSAVASALGITILPLLLGIVKTLTLGFGALALSVLTVKGAIGGLIFALVALIGLSGAIASAIQVTILGRLLAIPGAVAGATAAISTLAITAGSKLETSFRGVKEVLAGSVEDFTIFEDNILRLAGRMPETINQISEVTKAVLRAGVRAPQAVDTLTEKILDLGRLSDDSLENTADQVIKIARAFGLLKGDPVKNLQNFGDAIVTVFRRSVAGVDDLITGMRRMAQVSALFEVPVDQALALVAAVQEAGSTARISGTQISRFFDLLSRSLSDAEKRENLASILGVDSDEFTKRLRKDFLGTVVDIAKAVNESGDRIKVAGELFELLDSAAGKAIAGIAINVHTLEDTLEALVDKEGALEEATEQALGTFSRQFKILSGRLALFAQTLGLTFLTPFTEGLTKLNERFKDSVNFVVRLKNEMQRLEIPKDFFNRMLDILGIVEAFQGDFVGALEKVTQLITSLQPLLAGFVRPFANIIGSFAVNVILPILLNAVSSFIDSTKAFFLNFLKQIPGMVLRILPLIMNSIIEFMFTVIGFISRQIGRLGFELGKILERTIDKVISKITFGTELKNKLEQFGADVSGFETEIPIVGEFSVGLRGGQIGEAIGGIQELIGDRLLEGIDDSQFAIAIDRVTGEGVNVSKSIGALAKVLSGGATDFDDVQGPLIRLLEKIKLLRTDLGITDVTESIKVSQLEGNVEDVKAIGGQALEIVERNIQNLSAFAQLFPQFREQIEKLGEGILQPLFSRETLIEDFKKAQKKSNEITSSLGDILVDTANAEADFQDKVLNVRDIREIAKKRLKAGQEGIFEGVDIEAVITDLETNLSKLGEQTKKLLIKVLGEELFKNFSDAIFFAGIPLPELSFPDRNESFRISPFDKIPEDVGKEFDEFKNDFAKAMQDALAKGIRSGRLSEILSGFADVFLNTISEELARQLFEKAGLTSIAKNIASFISNLVTSFVNTLVQDLNQDILTGESGLESILKSAGTMIGKFLGELIRNALLIPLIKSVVNSFSTAGTVSLENAAPGLRFFRGGPVGETLQKMQSGGEVFGQSGIDRISALLTKGEFVIRRQAVNENTLPLLQAMNENPKNFQRGGRAGGGSGSSLSGDDKQQITYVIQAVDPASFEQLLNRNPDAVNRIVQQDIEKNGPTRKTIQRFS